MPDKYRSELPFDGATPPENAIWNALGDLPLEEPGDGIRHRFHRELERARRRSFASRLCEFAGFPDNPGWATAAACLLAGLLIGQVAGRTMGGGSGDEGRLAALESHVAELNRNLVLDRINSTEPGKRLQGVMDAAYLAEEDPAITAALLERAASDRVASIRSAAIGALGPRMASPDVGRQLMELLAEADSPLVQFALVELVLRHGDTGQLDQMYVLADRLHPDLQRYIDKSLGRESNET